MDQGTKQPLKSAARFINSLLSYNISSPGPRRRQILCCYPAVRPEWGPLTGKAKRPVHVPPPNPNPPRAILFRVKIQNAEGMPELVGGWVTCFAFRTYPRGTISFAVERKTFFSRDFCLPVLKIFEFDFWVIKGKRQKEN